MGRLPRRSSIALALAALCFFPPPLRAAAIPLDPVPPGGFQVGLERARLEQAAGHPRAVIAQLDSIDLAAQVGPDRERAAFLLAHAYLDLGSRACFRRVAATAAAWKSTGPYADWIARRLAVLEAEEGGAVPGTVPLVASAFGPDSSGAGARGGLLAAAADAMDARRWEDATELYARADGDWSLEQAGWRALLLTND